MFENPRISKTEEKRKTNLAKYQRKKWSLTMDETEDEFEEAINAELMRSNGRYRKS
jgi:hypothetical protein